MIQHMRSAFAVGLTLLSLVSALRLQRVVLAQNAPASVILKIGGNVSTPLELTAADLKTCLEKL
jgi:hypothetical protein